jgi:hypothetical protein
MNKRFSVILLSLLLIGCSSTEVKTEGLSAKDLADRTVHRRAVEAVNWSMSVVNFDQMAQADGSVDLYMGPTAPPGKEQNWIPTVPGKAWFAYFRLYAPTESYLDASWQLPDIEKTK